MALTEKERTLLKDLKNEEQLCADKYRDYAANASDGALKNMFQSFYSTENEHLNKICGFLGENPCHAQNGMQNNTQNNAQSNTQNGNPYSSHKVDYNSGAAVSGGMGSAYAGHGVSAQSDNYFCTDCLTLEKHLSSLYDTCVFESSDSELRNTLGNMQKDVQQQGKQLYDYMSSHGMTGSN